MKNLILFSLMIVLGQITYGQNDTVFIRYNDAEYNEDIKYQVDTVVYPSPMTRQILHGTTVLPNTKNQQIAKGYGLYLNEVEITPCSSERVSRRDEKIVHIIETDSTLTIELKIIGNCCHDFLCDVEILDENKINLIYHAYGASYCSCDCCFGLTYHFHIEQYDTYPKLKAVLINGEVRTTKTKR